MELPGKSWEGWHFSRGMLVTPEGRTLTGKDGSWWSLLVRQAQGFGQLYREAQMACINASHGAHLRQAPHLAQRPAVQADASAGAAPKTDTPPSNTGVNDGKWCESGAIMAPWPPISDSLLPSIPSPASTANGSESASIRSLVSPSTPTCEAPKPPQTRRLPPSLWPLNHSRQSLPQSDWPTFAVSLQGPFRLPPSPRTPAPRPDPPSFAATRRPSTPGRPQTPKADSAGGAV